MIGFNSRVILFLGGFKSIIRFNSRVILFPGGLKSSLIVMAGSGKDHPPADPHTYPHLRLFPPARRAILYNIGSSNLHGTSKALHVFALKLT